MSKFISQTASKNGWYQITFEDEDGYRSTTWQCTIPRDLREPEYMYPPEPQEEPIPDYPSGE